MRNMYSRFRPHRRELERDGRRVRRAPGDIPGSRTFPGTASDRHKGETVKQILNLDGHELFTQLVAQSNLVKIGPRNGLFTCFVEVEEGVVRVWRGWLKAMALKSNDVISEVTQDAVTRDRKGKAAVGKMSGTARDLDDESILWVSPAKNTGLRFNIRERKMVANAPILIRADEDPPVSYEIEYDGMQPLFLKYLNLLNGARTTHSDITSFIDARKVLRSGRQHIRQSSCFWLFWMID